MLYRMLPPMRQTRTDCGSRVYESTGAAMDVDQAHVDMLAGEGWIKVAPSAMSHWHWPVHAAHGAMMVDRKYGMLAYDAAAGAWRSVITGQPQ